MHIQSINNKPQFKAKFLDTYAIRKVAEWANEHGKYKELNEARKRIESNAVNIRLELTLGTNLENNCPIAIFRRYTPKYELNKENITEEDFTISYPLTYQTKRMINPYEYGFTRIMQMSHYIPDNKLYREIVIGPQKI